MNRTAVVLATLLLLIGTGASAESRLRFVQLSSDGDPMKLFDFTCGAARCFGTAQITDADGATVWLEGEGQLTPGLLRLLLEVEGTDISTPGPFPIELQDGRAVVDVPLVRGWREDGPLLRDGVWRRPEPAGIRLRVAIGP